MIPLKVKKYKNPADTLMDAFDILHKIKAAALKDGVPEHVIDKALEKAKTPSTKPYED